MTKPDWLSIHTPLEAIHNDGVATIRTSLVGICDGNYCAAMILDEFYFQAYCRAGYPNPEAFENPSHMTDIPELIIMMSNMFDGKATIEALKIIASKGYANIEISENYYVACELSLEAIHRDLSAQYPQYAYTRVSSETKIETPKPERQSQEVLIISKPQRAKRNEAKVVRFHNSRASTIALPATLTLEQWKQTLKDFDNKCAYCSTGEYEILEHFIPLIFGGGTTSYNCVPACYSCNRIKSDQHPSMMPENCEIAEGLLSVQGYLETRRSRDSEGEA